MAEGPDLDATFAALSDPARRAIVDLLRQRPRRSTDLATELALSRPAVSKHLRALRGAGLVDDEPVEGDARARTVRLRRQPFAALRGWVEDVEGFWTEQLEAFRAHAERRAAERPAKPSAKPPAKTRRR